jgi:hypothetical protein
MPGPGICSGALVVAALEPLRESRLGEQGSGCYSSTNRFGQSEAVIAEVIWNTSPKWRVRRVEVSAAEPN